MSRIPTLDIRRFTHPESPEDRDAFVRELAETYREWGFAGIRGHGIDDALVDAAYDDFKAFFDLPEHWFADKTNFGNSIDRKSTRLNSSHV